MIFGTLLSVAFAAFYLFMSSGQTLIPNTDMLGIAMLVFGISSLSLLMLTMGLSWSPLQKTEENLTSRLLVLFKKDLQLHFALYLLIILSLISIFFAINAFLHIFLKPAVVVAWIVLLGISLDGWYYLLQRVSNYFNPFGIVQLFTKEAIVSIRNEKEGELCDWIDSLSEVSTKALQRHSNSLCINALDSMPVIAADFLDSAKSIGHHIDETQSTQKFDQVSYTLFYMFQHFETVFNIALQHRIEPICSKLITILGKIAISAAKLDLTLVSYPVHFIGKFAKYAQENKMQDVAVKATIILLEVSKAIVTEVNVTYADLKDPFFSIITHLDEIAKETFKQDKNINIKFLAQPFRDLKDLFTNERVANHQDTPAIVQKLDQVINEFDTLEIVMKRLPPLPNLSTEEPLETPQ
jgi:hypothetical protein